MMDINKELATFIENRLNYKGLGIKIGRDTEAYETGFIDVEKDREERDIETYVEGKHFDEYLFLHTFVEMLINNEVNIVFSENASEKRVNYLNKLSESIKKGG